MIRLRNILFVSMLAVLPAAVSAEEPKKEAVPHQIPGGGKGDMNFLLGYEYQQKGHLDAALQEYRKALQKDPKLYDALFNSGVIHIQQNRKQDALEAFTRCIGIRPAAPEAYQAIAATYAKDGQLDKVAAILKKGVTNSPKETALRRDLAATYLRMGKPDDAIRTLEEGAKLSPDSRDIRYMLGMAYKNKNRFDPAIRELKAVTSANPKDFDGWYNLGDSYRRKGDFDNAVTALQTATSLNDKSAISHAMLGLCYRQKKMDDKAKAEYETAIKLDPKGVAGKIAHEGLKALNAR